MNLLEEVSLPAPLAVPDCGGVGALSDQEVGPAPGDRVNILQKIGKGLFKSNNWTNEKFGNIFYSRNLLPISTFPSYILC